MLRSAPDKTRRRTHSSISVKSFDVACGRTNYRLGQHRPTSETDVTLSRISHTVHHRQKLGFSRVSRYSRVRVRIRVSVRIKPRLHDTTGCPTGCMNSTCLIYATQHPTVCVLFDNRLNNRLHRLELNKHSTVC